MHLRGIAVALGTAASTLERKSQQFPHQNTELNKMSLTKFKELLAATEYFHAVTDNGPGDPAETEVDAALSAVLPHLKRIKHTSLPRNTIATGLIVQQLGLQRYPLRPKKMGMYVNCAPREDDNGVRSDNEGEPLVIGILAGDVPFLAVHSGHSLSWVRQHIEWLHHCVADTVPWPNLRGGEQFRSARMFPRGFYEVLDGDGESVLGDQLSPLASIPAPVIDTVGWIDTPHLNIKSSTFEGEGFSRGLTYGDLVQITINHVTIEATYAKGIFAVEKGKFVLAPGSSGHRPDGRRLLEVCLRSGYAAAQFHHPLPGDPIVVQPAHNRAVEAA
jgi:hypothetical protein